MIKCILEFFARALKMTSTGGEEDALCIRLVRQVKIHSKPPITFRVCLYNDMNYLEVVSNNIRCLYRTDEITTNEIYTVTDLYTYIYYIDV
jgi:hypothetical protein